MNFDEARVGMEILGRYTCGQKRDWGDEENRQKMIDGSFEFGHEVCWISLPRTTNDPEITAEERRQLEDAGWFFDEENESWSHF